MVSVVVRIKTVVTVDVICTHSNTGDNSSAMLIIMIKRFPVCQLQRQIDLCANDRCSFDEVNDEIID